MDLDVSLEDLYKGKFIEVCTCMDMCMCFTSFNYAIKQGTPSSYVVAKIQACAPSGSGNQEVQLPHRDEDHPDWAWAVPGGTK